MVYIRASNTKIKISKKGGGFSVSPQHANLAKKENCKMSHIYT